VVKVQRLVAAAAALAGRAIPTEADLWPIVFAVPEAAGQDVARDTLRDLLDRTENAALLAAAVEASLGPLARARRMVADGEALLAAPEVSSDAWRLKLEGVAREIDAGFAAESRPADLGEIRRRIVEALAAR
jgi:MoxR-like ATPase